MNAMTMRNIALPVDQNANYHWGRQVSLGFTSAGSIQWSAAAAFRASVAIVQTPMVARFRRLADHWAAETENMSSVDDMILHPAYQEIIGMGPAIITLLLDELEREPNHWFPALQAISGGQNPVPVEYAGDIDKMAEAWLDWAQANGYR